ncbi:MAG TPA: MarR family transcriptional regulator [Chloroflexia bacterium]|nr:MarR family transcriptional regulator [Chloroflexia bacterium]
MDAPRPGPAGPAPLGPALTADQAAECLMHLLPALFRQLWADARQELAATYALTEMQLGILHTLRHHDYTIGEVAERMKLHLPTVSRTSETLVAQGYLVRGADADDRRKVRLALTAPGRALADTAHRHFHNVVARHMAVLDDADVACIVGACAAFEKLLAGAPAGEGPGPQAAG